MAITSLWYSKRKKACPYVSGFSGVGFAAPDLWKLDSVVWTLKNLLGSNWLIDWPPWIRNLVIDQISLPRALMLSISCLVIYNVLWRVMSLNVCFSGACWPLSRYIQRCRENRWQYVCAEASETEANGGWPVLPPTRDIRHREQESREEQGETEWLSRNTMTTRTMMLDGWYNDPVKLRIKASPGMILT